MSDVQNGAGQLSVQQNGLQSSHNQAQLNALVQSRGGGADEVIRAVSALNTAVRAAINSGWVIDLSLDDVTPHVGTPSLRATFTRSV